MNVVALVISGLSLLTSVVGIVLSYRRSGEALAQSRLAEEKSELALTDSRWSEVLGTVQLFVGLDPFHHDFREPFLKLRVAGIDLVDHLKDWEGLGTWLEVERLLGAAFSRELLDRVRKDDTPDERAEKMASMLAWASALTNNLRIFRSTGYDAAALAELEDHARSVRSKVYERNNWGVPKDDNSLIEPLRDS